MKQRQSNRIERQTLDLWPETGRRLGLGRNATYEAAKNGEIPGLLRIGGRWLVAREALEQALRVGLPEAK